MMFPAFQVFPILNIALSQFFNYLIFFSILCTQFLF